MRLGLPVLLFPLLVSACAVPADPVDVTPTAEAEVDTSIVARSAGSVRHIGNAGLLIAQGDTKILFDPLYRNGYNNYHLVPEAVKADVLAGAPPFDNIDAVLVSHAHGDHFDAADIIAFHAGNPDALIIGPPQAIEAIEETGDVSKELRERFVSMGLEYGQDPLSIAFESLNVEAVRIPHAGGLGRREIENLVYRVTLEGAATVMHMGDADPAIEHFTPFAAHWQAKATDTAFPPYWFFLSAEGVQIVDGMLNTSDAIGVHVPVKIPDDLAASGRNFFGAPGGVRTLGNGDRRD